MIVPRRPWSRAALIAALAAAAYAGTLWNDLVWDDRLSAIAPTLAPRPGQWWRPVVMATFAAELAIHGGTPAAMHATNVVLHAAVAVLLERWARTLGLPPAAALLAALAFAVHPVQSEAVAYVSGRTDLLCALFVLSALLVWRGARRATDGRACLTTALLLLALGSKEAALLVPLVLVAPGVHPGPERPRPVLPLAAALAWGALFASRTSLELPSGGVLARLPAMAEMALDYLRLLVWPSDLHLERFVAVAGRGTAHAVLVVLGAAAALALAVGVARRVPDGVVSLALLGATYLPVAGVVPVYPAIADRALFAAEHFLYLPLLGAAPLAAGGAVRSWPARWGRRPAWAIGAVVLATWTALTVARVREWRDEETLYRHTLAYEPPAARVWYNLGNLRLAAGDAAEAARLFAAALAREPASAATHLNLGIALARLGRTDEALRHYAEALRLDPGLAAAFRPRSPR